MLIRSAVARVQWVTFEALLDQVGQVSQVVHVCVGDNHRIDGFRIEGKVQVALVSLSPAPLKKAAIQQQFVSVDVDQVPRAGYGTIGAVETYVNQ